MTSSAFYYYTLLLLLLFFYLGLKYVQELADLPTELWVDASFQNDESVHERYGRFELIGTNYKLSVDTQPLEKSGDIPLSDLIYYNINKNELYLEL
jgi:hypothetical protein